MSDIERIYTRMGETLQAFSPFYQEVMIKHLRESEAPERWFSLNFVRASEPQPFNLAHSLELNPYTALSLQRERFETLAAAGCLEESGDDTYRLTDKGRQIVEGFFSAAHSELAKLEVLAAGEMNQLAELLGRIVMSTIESAEPVAKPALMASRWTDPGPDAAAAARIDQHVTDLLRYRDDAHIGAWRPTGIDGKSWEALTLLWRGEADSVTGVNDRLTGRGYGSEEKAEALSTLEEKEWITQDGENLQISEAGKRVRQEAEEETDRLWRIGWAALEQDELELIDTLLVRLNERLQALALSACWTQSRQLSQAVFPVTREAVNEIFNNYFDSPRAFFPTLMAFGARPEALSMADYSGRFPYTKPERAMELLGLAAASGCLAADGDSFTITEKGTEAITQVNDVFYRYLGEIDPLEEEESAELAKVMTGLVEASLAADEPKLKWGTANMHACHPDEQYGSLASIDQSIDDLNAFRDEAHIAAWQAHGIGGRDWDTLTLVWRGEAGNGAEIAEAFEFKGYSADEYAQSLEALAGRGWLRETAEGYEVTESGRQVRQEAEVNTDRIFFEPWQALSGEELLRLHTLLLQMKLGLQELAEQEADE